MTRDETDHEFLEYVTAHQASLRHTAYLLCGDRGMAEDAVQTALVKVYLRWTRIERQNAVHSYSKRAVVTAVIDEFRRPWRRATVMAELPDTHSVTDGTQTVDDRLVLRQALASLPARQRAAVMLRYVEDLDVAQTAELMRCRPSTVANACAAALASLRTFLIRHGVVRTAPDTKGTL